MNAGGTPGASGGTAGSAAGTANTAGHAAGTGATNAAGGATASGGMGGAASAVDGAAARVQACLAYANAVCKRRSVCTGSADLDCESAGADCPDVTFSPGSQRTVQGLLACAKDYESFSCDAMAREEVPPCVTAGTRATGEPCVFSSQCASLACRTTTPGDCGKCAARVGQGQACKDAADVVCDFGLGCDQTTGKCTPPPPPPSRPSARQPGEACNRALDTCIGKDYTCTGTDADPSAYQCRPEARLGESCARERDCASDSYCPLALVCAALPSVGQPCGIDAWVGKAFWCDANSSCKCNDLPDCKTGTCRAPAQAGEDCGQNPCAQGLSCRCADITTRDACKCIDYQDVGEPCGTPTTMCWPWATCNANLCTAVTSQNRFANACGP